jgi:hypothetical protein
MQPGPADNGRRVLVAVTLLAVALQAIKLVSRAVLVDRWPSGGQWGQLGLVIWLLLSLWDGKNWARVAAAAYYTLATLAGILLLWFMWDRVGPALRWVTVLTILLAAVVASVLWLSPSLRRYMAERLADEPMGAGNRS